MSFSITIMVLVYRLEIVTEMMPIDLQQTPPKLKTPQGDVHQLSDPRVKPLFNAAAEVVKYLTETIAQQKSA
jgi:hypothetical protein